MRARAGGGEVDRCSAVGTVDRLNVLLQFLYLLWRQLADEILLPQEVDKSDVTTVFSGAP